MSAADLLRDRPALRRILPPPWRSWAAGGGAEVLLRIALVRLIHTLASRLPVQDRIVLATSHGAALGGNLAAIRAELARRGAAVRVVVLASAPRRGARGRVAAALASMRGAFHLATSRVLIVDDYFFPIYVVTPRRGTHVVQTWHAAGALKKMGRSLGGKTFGGGPALRARVPIHANYEICLVSSSRFVDAYADAFGLARDRFVSSIGLPRTDILFGDAATGAERRVRERYGIGRDRTVILYAPTFRGDNAADAEPGPLLDLPLLRTMLGPDHLVLLRLHPFVRARVELEPELRGFVIDVSNHREINELMLVSDLLVTDYSSAIFEFAILERPIGLFAPDLAAYERERGFYSDYRTAVPGPVFETTADLAAWIRRGVFDLDRVRSFRDASFDVLDGAASARFVERVAVPLLRDRAVIA
ncbi:MAG TPA: CDP-glycerol glycerophosphotransferase family protein [Candidatus Limnocylindrales bacterium]|nr:CDP-glycerol glycerophosphotransferase family protein [Candidatus Limnocylindrales bacterium]